MSVTRDQLVLWWEKIWQVNFQMLINIRGASWFSSRIKLGCDRSDCNCPELTLAVKIKGAKSFYRCPSIYTHNNGELFLLYMALSFTSNSANYSCAYYYKTTVIVSRGNNVNSALLMSKAAKCTNATLFKFKWNKVSLMLKFI